MKLRKYYVIIYTVETYGLFEMIYEIQMFVVVQLQAVKVMTTSHHQTDLL